MTSAPVSISDGDVLYRCEADPFSSAWVRWSVKDKAQFNAQFGDLHSRRDGDRAILRLQPHASLSNRRGNLHGGAIMSFIDMGMFICAEVLGVAGAMPGNTIDLSVQFVDGAILEQPVDAVMQLTRETGRFLFMRGTVEQAGNVIASFIGTLRKNSQ